MTKRETRQYEAKTVRLMVGKVEVYSHPRNRNTATILIDGQEIINVTRLVIDWNFGEGENPVLSIEKIIEI